MKQFRYAAVDVAGKPVRGTLQAEDQAAAAYALEQSGLFPIEIVSVFWSSERAERFFAYHSIKPIEVIEFAKNLSVMLRAGISIMTALSDIIDTTENKKFASVLRNVKQTVERGSSFTGAIERHPEVFPNIFIRLVRVGEETGQFPSSLAEVAKHLAKIENMTTTMKRAMLYPVFAIVTTFGALVFWMIYVLPKIIDTMKVLGVQLPPLTRALIACSQFSQKNWYLILSFPVLIAALIRILNKKSSTRYYLDQAKLKLPIISQLLRDRSIALFLEQMYITVHAGLNIDKSFDLASDTIGNEVYRRSLLRVKDAVITGKSIAQSLRAEAMYPMLVVRMVGIGETSGTLENQFSYLSEHYCARVDNLFANLGKMLEPVVIMVVGFVFIIIILGLLMPIYELVSNVGKIT